MSAELCSRSFNSDFNDGYKTCSGSWFKVWGVQVMGDTGAEGQQDASLPLVVWFSLSSPWQRVPLSREVPEREVTPISNPNTTKSLKGQTLIGGGLGSGRPSLVGV